MEKPNDWLNCFNHIEIHISRLFFFFLFSLTQKNQQIRLSGFLRDLTHRKSV